MDITSEQIEQLIEELRLPEGDLYLFGDGSGTTLELSCSHFVTLFERSTQEVKHFLGGFSNGTNNFAELMPYLHALWAYDATHKDKTKKVKVVILSDSELTVRQGTGQYTRNANLPLWAMMDWFTKNGYEIAWHHVRRNTNFLMKLADKRAGEFRCIIIRTEHNQQKK